jgi:hypothetical protein
MAISFGSQQAVSLVIGMVLMAINIGLLAWAVRQFLAKKSVALASMVIVIKYVLLAAGLYWMSTQPWASVGWFGIGVLFTMMSAVLYGVIVGTF